MLVTLTEIELDIAAFLADERDRSAQKSGKRDAHGRKQGDGLGDHYLGACAELAVSKVLNCYPCFTLDTYKLGGDLGQRIQVRGRRRADYDLLVRPNDREEDLFVLALGDPEKGPDFDVVGWCSGRAAKMEAFLQNYGGRDYAYFVPKEILDPDLGKLKQLAFPTEADKAA